MKQIRLDKYLAQCEGLSRSEAKQYIKKGRVAIDGIPAKKPEQKVDIENTTICIDGVPCHFEEYSYVMLNKPSGVISATEDSQEKTVLDIIKEPIKDLFPVGRLDKDTEGLLLLTNDGKLAHELLAPKKHVDKCYYAVLDGAIGEREQKIFAEGLDIGEEKRTLPAKLIKAEDKENGVYITICEGKFHQIKRMAKAVGREVLYLKRVSMGSLLLDDGLKPGEYRFLTMEEINGLKGK